jgi:hypothetical protein
MKPNVFLRSPSDLVRRALGAALFAALATGWFAPAANAAPNVVYSCGDPLPEEQYMLQLVNFARANPLAEAALCGIDLNEGLSSNTISPAPKQPLAFNPDLLQSSLGHSEWMITNGMFSHIETDGSDPGDRMASAGYVFSGSWAWGENIAWAGTTGPPPSVGPTVAQEEEDLFVDTSEPGRGHRLNILDRDFREIGIGIVTGVFASDSNNYNAVMITQDFADSDADPGPFLVGVVYKDADGNGLYGIGEGISNVTVMPASGTYFAVSSTSGGYAIPIPGQSGTLSVTFSGGPLSASVTKTVALTGSNVELDFELNEAAALPLAFVPGSAKFASGGRFEADVQGPASAAVMIEGSSDFSTWETVGHITLVGGKGHLTDTPPTGTNRRFYRALALY